jgi:hypothetical protein
MLNSRTNLVKWHKFNHEDFNLLVNTIVGKMARKFEELIMDGHNYLTCTMYVKICLVLCRLYEAILPPEERIVPLLNPSIMFYT